MDSFKHTLLLGITGSIAAYKSAELIRLLQQAGAHINVVLTKGGEQFITPLTLKALCQGEVYTEQNENYNTGSSMPHITLARRSQSILIAPASANCIARLAHGLCDDLLSTLCLATQVPITLAPAMNPIMWQHPATQQNIKLLKSRGVQLIGPTSGEHACGETGFGRMLEPDEIVKQLTLNTQPQTLANKRALITAGPTHEAIDPLRYLGNRSSGKMGYALAVAAQQAGAQVTLVSGPTALATPAGVKRVNISSAHELLSAVEQSITNQDIFISAAAVADYRVKQYSQQKIKKQSDDITLTLTRNPDVLAQIKQQNPQLFCVGFAAETENLIDNAKQKLHKKQLDLIIANPINQEYGIAADNNQVTLIDKQEQMQEFTLENKTTLAVKLICAITEKYIKSLHERDKIDNTAPLI